MKRKALAIVLTLIMLVGVLPMGAFAAPETDAEVPAEAETKAVTYTDTEGHWAQKSIDRWTEAKNPAGQTVLEGMGNNIFAPDDNLTRAQAMTIFSRLLNLVKTADISKVTDVASDAWYAQWIQKGYAYEIIKGTSDTTFDPDGDISREQFFSIFARAMGIPGADKLAEGKTFTDLDAVSPWFVEEGTVYAMINAGYLNGYPDGSLQPQASITRAEVAQVLANAIDINGYITTDGTYNLKDVTGMVVVLAKNVTLTGAYTGHIVSSCVDSTLYTTQVNPSSVRAAVNVAAKNVKVTNVGVANPPYTPANPYNPNGGNYVYVLQDNTNINPVTINGSTGGPGRVTPIDKDKYTTTTYQVVASLTFKNTKTHGVDKLSTSEYKIVKNNTKNVVTEDTASAVTMEAVINELGGISDTKYAQNNKAAIEGAYSEIYNRLTQDNSGNVVTKSWTSDEGYKLDVNVNGEEGTIAFWNNALPKTESYLSSFSTNFSNVMSDIAKNAAVPADIADIEKGEYGAFVKAVDPANLFTAVEGNTYQMMAPDAFFDGYWTNVVSKGIALLGALQDAGYDNYQTLFDSVLAATTKVNCNVDQLAGVGVNDAEFLTDRQNYQDGHFNFVSFNNEYTGAVSVLNAAEKVLTSEIVDKPSAQAFARLVDRDNIINLNGDLNLSVELVKTETET